MATLLDRVMSPLPSAKGLQKDFREPMRDFVKEKRRDFTKVHVLYWNEEDGLMEVEFADGPAFQEQLQGMVADGCGLIAVVAGGKPLPAERIDALKADAQRRAADKFLAVLARADQESELDAEATPPPGIPPEAAGDRSPRKFPTPT